MATITARRIVNVDRMKDGVIIKFDDGKCAFYPCAFLYAKLQECEELNEDDPRW